MGVLPCFTYKVRLLSLAQLSGLFDWQDTADSQEVPA